MLGNCDLELLVPDLDAEVGKVSHGWADVHQAILDIVGTQTRRTDKLLSK